MTNDEQLVREYLRPLRTAEPVRRRPGTAPSGGWGGRIKLGVAIAVGAAVVAGVLLMLALAAQSRSSNRPAHRPPPSTATAQDPAFREAPAPPPPAAQPDGRFGEPVKLDNMTFVVNSLTAAASVPIPNSQPLLAEPGKRLWLLTVSVRNDGATTEREPFCHRRHRPGRTDYLIKHGPELVTKDSNWVGWLRESLLIDHDLCRVIRPGQTTTFQLIYGLSRGSNIASVYLHKHTEPGERVDAWVVR